MILVSACLCGQRCRYDGQTKKKQALITQLGRENILPVCPEQLGGLATPRPACRLLGGDGADVLAGCARVVDELGVDRTGAFVKGARLTLEMALSHGVDRCCLKAKSPSCGSGLLMALPPDELPDGYRPVLGVAAALLQAHGFHIEEVL
ncbi:hypothetical protein DSCA_30560 [Desulfosarcina alkanivorans]|uniref:Uncharacterized protein n=1 Tax=Desulfosarcina alkanivorans TaxID=571177 RepID=A0A5K7YIY4_9BACT|nr:DUF523 domain-containing protein [Desulfosarcina alkanivorans]BBO69126.1 hypothetical protein DSCA_30560 [Desulfosarcina alkanivorans]